jgi:hypothetical protein
MTIPSTWLVAGSRRAMPNSSRASPGILAAVLKKAQGFLEVLNKEVLAVVTVVEKKRQAPESLHARGYFEALRPKRRKGGLISYGDGLEFAQALSR